MPSTINLTPTPESSQIQGFGYEPSTKRLAVRFKSSPDRTYEYKDVSPELAAGMAASDSKGGYLYKHIKPSHEFERFVDEPVESEGGEA